MGVSAVWVCTRVYDMLAIGFSIWIGSILAMALASFLISGSYLMEDNTEHERLLAELTKTCGDGMFEPGTEASRGLAKERP